MRLLIPTIAFLLAAGNAMTQTREPLRYTLRFPAAATHYTEAGLEHLSRGTGRHVDVLVV